MAFGSGGFTSGGTQGAALQIEFGAPVQNVADLRAIGVVSRNDQMQRLVEDKGVNYRFDSTGVGADDGDLIIVPTVGSGRWFKTSQVAGGAPAAHAPSHSDAGTDEVTVENLATSEPSTTKALMSDGAGGLVFGAPAPGAHAASHLPAGADPLALALPVDVTKAANAAGVAESFSRSDHKHDASTAVAGATAIGDAAAEGVATSLARSDHQHSSAAPAAPADVTKAAAATGVSTAPARADHKHDVSTGVPSAIGTTNVEGTATSLARSDHVHGHSSQAGGETHADAIAGGADGFMTGADKTKLDGIEALADVTDATNVAAAGAVMDSDFADAEGFMRKVSAGTYIVHKSNLAATTNPGVSDDNTAGYSIGSRWINVTLDKIFEAVDVSTGAAVWKDLAQQVEVVITGSQDLTAGTPFNRNITGAIKIKRITRARFWISVNGADVGANTTTKIQLKFFNTDGFTHAELDTDGLAELIDDAGEFQFDSQDVKVAADNGDGTIDIDATANFGIDDFIRIHDGTNFEYQRVLVDTDADTLDLYDTILKAGVGAWSVNDDVARVFEFRDLGYRDQDDTDEIHLRLIPRSGDDNCRIHWWIEYEGGA